MRHRKKRTKLSRTKSHRRALFANMLKSLVEYEKIKTTLIKAKELKKLADSLIDLAKKDTLFSKREIKSKLMIRFNPLTCKEKRRAKAGDFSSYNIDRKIFKKLDMLKDRFKNRIGGYTRIIKTDFRKGDGASMCLIEFLED